MTSKSYFLILGLYLPCRHGRVACFSVRSQPRVVRIAQPLTGMHEGPSVRVEGILVRVLVLGGDGYLGGRRLSTSPAAGHEVAMVDNFIRRRYDLELGTAAWSRSPTLPERVARWRAVTGAGDRHLRRRSDRSGVRHLGAAAGAARTRSSTSPSSGRRPTR